MMKPLIALTMLAALVGCDGAIANKSAEAQQRAATEQLTAEAQRHIGMPNIINFQERKLMRQIMELRDKEDLVTYAYITTWDGELIYIGQCVGFGLPYSVQYTNPEKPLTGGNHGGGYWGTTIPQPDPNGLYMPEGLSATWLMMLDPDSGDVRPVYVEPQIIVSPFKLH